jgi:predicted ATPase
MLVEQGASARILTLLTCRPDFHAAWASHSHVTHAILGQLSRTDTEKLLAGLTAGKQLPAQVLQQLIVKTDGVPLFVEELTRMVLESGLLRERDGGYDLTASLPLLAIPTTLHDSLVARLDRMANAKEVAAAAATLGREFSYEMLRAVSPFDETVLRHGLSHLVAAELLYQLGAPQQVAYKFKHALIQEAAYQSLLKSRRQQYHQRIARVLEERFHETTQAEPELLAHHYTEAGLVAEAIPYWQRAGQRAMDHSANVEAVSHLTKGLQALKLLPDSLERARQELSLLTALGLALVATKGQAHEEVEHTYIRARELALQTGGTRQLFVALCGLVSGHTVRSELQAAQEVAEQLLELAEREQDLGLRVAAHWALGSALLFRGEPTSARAQFEHGISLYNPQQQNPMVFVSGFPADLGVFCRCLVAHALWHLGYLDQALLRIAQAIALAEELAHPYSRALALAYAAMLYQFRREGDKAGESAEKAMTLCNEHAFVYYKAWAETLQGWALVLKGQGEAGLAQMRGGVNALRATGAELRLPYYFALLAQACLQTSQVEEARELLAESLAGAQKKGEHWNLAELHRLKGELLLRAGGSDCEAEACFEQALSVASQQQAKSLELRAAMSLARLWQRQRRCAEACELLAPIYQWFTEGFDTSDLQQAKALLDALTGVLNQGNR